MKPILSFLLLLLSMAATVSASDQKLEVAAPFTDNMILQRQSAVPVWGFDAPGTKITVEFAGQKKTAVSDKNGDWMVKLTPLKASRTERTFKVTNNKGESINLKDVLVGEVWFSSGQSNMVWVACKSMCDPLGRKLAESEEDIPIREIKIDTVSALYPQKKATSDRGWKKSKSYESFSKYCATHFSALSLSFAHELYKELDVPIGILLSAHSNTRIEAFTQRQAFEKHPLLKGDVDLMHDGDPLTEQGRNAFEQYYQDLRVWQKEAGEAVVSGGKIPNRPNLPGIAGMWRGPSQFFSGKINPVVPYAVRGAIWCQGTSNSNDGPIYAARMEALVNGWRDAWSMPNMPFYFTQMQCYGDPDPNRVGFADIRQAQHKFFMENRKNVGMVVQTDLNSARPGGIHYSNKLHPGMRMARWALAKEYGKDIAYTGPIYTGYKVNGDKAIVSFEKGSLFGGLMVGSKGMAKDVKEPGKYVEPAKPTPNDKLNHFRLCDKDKKWHAADAVIVGDTVEVSSKDVPNLIGVQYAYNGSPLKSNLYNKAGLPATPFASVDGKLIFEDQVAKAAAQKARYASHSDPNRPIFDLAPYYRDSIIIQRDKKLTVWGRANKGIKVTVTLGDITRTAVANDAQDWAAEFPPMKASAKPITLTVKSSHGHGRTVKDILVGDVWYVIGGEKLTKEWAYDPRDKKAKIPEAMPLVREFRRKTSGSWSTAPRKHFETGGGARFRSNWETADFSVKDKGVTMFAYQFAKALNRQGVPQGFMNIPSGNGRFKASPLSWTPFDGVKDIKNPAFKGRMDELLLQFPNTDVAKKAADDYVQEVKGFVKTITDAGKRGADMSKVQPLRGPLYPVAGQSATVKADMIPTYAYNWCVSPLTPMTVAGVLWVPELCNIGYTPANYATELEIYAKSLPKTYGMDKVQFIYAQPAASLVKGITTPKIPGAKCVTFDKWPNSLKDLAAEMAKQAE
jgi:sialate O-acetylesterase